MEIKLKHRTSNVPLIERLEVQIHGRRIVYLLDLNAPSQRLIFECFKAGILYEMVTVLALDRFLEPGDVFIDLGSHVGYFSMIASVMVGPSGRVVSIEPEQRNFDSLRANIRENGADNVVPIRAAIGDHVGLVDVYENADNDGGHALWRPELAEFHRQSNQPGSRPFEVRSVTLDSIVEELGIKRVKAIKMDVEGCEPKAVRGGLRLFSEPGVDLVVCELNEFALCAMGSSASELIRSLYQCGFSGFTSNDGSDFKEITLSQSFEPVGEWAKQYRQWIENLFFIHRSYSPAR